MTSSLSRADARAIARLDAHDQAALVRTRQLPREALVEVAVACIDASDGALNSIAVRAFDHARAALATVDPAAPMAAVPYLLKASLEYPGFPVEAGSRARRGQVAKRAFPLVQRLDALGLVPIGMSTMPEFGLNASGEALLYGPTRNPWDMKRSAGGSSTGAAVAVAAGLVPFATASDAGGSIRIPAAHCGIVGFKPSRGWNLPARPWNLVDNALCSDALYGRSMRDTAWAARMLRPDPAPSTDIRPLRIALDLTGLDGHDAEREVTDVILRTAALCEDLGHHVEERRQPIDRAALRTGFTTLWDYLGGEIVDLYGDRAAELLEPWTLGLGERRRSITAQGLSDALAQIDRSAAALREFYRGFDVVLSPVTASPPPKLGHLAPTRPTDELWDALFAHVSYTPLHNMSGSPSISLPIFLGASGLPVGSMFSADHGQDELLLALGTQIEAAAPWANRWPTNAF